MVNFDDFFAKKLDEEHSFPHRERNWRIVQKRLDASGSKTRPLPFPHMRIWKIAATVLLLITGWLAWALVAEQREHAALHRQMATLPKREDSPAAPNPVHQREKASSGIGRSDGQPPPHPVTRASTVSNMTARQDENDRVQPVAEAENVRNIHSGLPPVPEQPAFPETEKRADTQDALARNEPETREKDREPPDIQIVEKKNDTIQSEPDPEKILAEAAASDAPGQEKNAGTDTLATSNTLPAEIIKPARARERVRAGIHFLTGIPLPYEKGVSLLTGHGFRAEFALTKSLWLTASADWLRLEVSTNRFVPHLHNHDHDPDTLHGSPQSKLVKVESTQRRQQFGAGLRYALPTRGWLKPSFRAAYTWTRISPETIRFRFEKPQKNEPPEFVVHKYEAKQLKSILCLGIGVEHETPHWVFGLWADYSRNYARSDAGFDALLVEGGLLYRFN